MSLLAVIGAGLQLALLLFTHWIKNSGKKEAERKELENEGVKAIRSGDTSRINAVFARLR